MRLWGIFAISLWIAGCDLVMPYVGLEDARPRDAEIVADRPPVPALDSTVDAPVPALDSTVDAPVPALDSTVDAPVPTLDSTVDAPVPALDSTVDAPVPTPDSTEDALVPAPDATEDALVPAPDATEDALVPAPDATVDAPPPTLDATVDAPTPIQGACVPGATEKTPWSTTAMVVCSHKTLAVDQCNAASLCATSQGWTLCTASEYQSRGGKSQGFSSTTFAWIAGCIRDGSAKPRAPTDTICGGCYPATATSQFHGWYCSTPTTGTFGLTERQVGVTTHSLCMRVGVSDSTTEAHWRPRVAHLASNAAVCCYNK